MWKYNLLDFTQKIKKQVFYGKGEAYYGLSESLTKLLSAIIFFVVDVKLSTEKRTYIHTNRIKYLGILECPSINVRCRSYKTHKCADS